ncbi:unnamed protein product [Fusarium graminearum]|nr:unnamed protein product [Fusarium graminearum]
MPRPEDKYPVLNYPPDVRFLSKLVDQLLIWAYFELMSILTTHIDVNTGYRFSPAFKRAVANKQSLIAAGSAALAVDLSRQWIIGKLRNEKTFNHWFTNYYCLAHAALHNNHDRDRNDANTEEYCGRLKK